MASEATLREVAQDAIKQATDLAIKRLLDMLYDIHGESFCTRAEKKAFQGDIPSAVDMLGSSSYFKEIYCFLQGWRECKVWAER